MLLFLTVPPDSLQDIARQGISGPVKLTTTYEGPAHEKGVVLVVNPLKLPDELVWYAQPVYEVPRVPAKAIENVDFTHDTRRIIAGGGYVLRRNAAGLDVLMIYRKGMWDLPKGKLDPGETIEDCAMREVREEVGIGKLHLGEPLGATVHGYERKNAYWVKTTYWYAMETPEETFQPQAAEQIEAVSWMPWAEAVDKIGYEIFRRHMVHIEPRIKNAGAMPTAS